MQCSGHGKNPAQHGAAHRCAAIQLLSKVRLPASSRTCAYMVHCDGQQRVV